MLRSMSDPESYPVPAAAAANTRTTATEYAERYARSLAHPDGFWRDEVARLDWLQQPTLMGNWSWDPVDIRWFEDGVLNASANCLDRHDPAATAIVWEPDDPAHARSAASPTANCSPIPVAWQMCCARWASAAATG